MTAQQSLIVNHVKTVSIQVLIIVHKAVRMHLLLLCCESSRKCYHAAQHTLYLDKTNLTCFTKIIACAPYHGQIWMNYVPKCTVHDLISARHVLKSVLLYLFLQFWEILSQTTGFALDATQCELILKVTMEKTNGYGRVLQKLVLLISHPLSVNMRDQCVIWNWSK